MQRRRTRADQNTTIILDELDVRENRLKSSLGQVRSSGKVRLGTGTNGRVRGAEERLTVANGIVTSREAVVEDVGSFHLLGVRHRTGQTTCTDLREGVVQIVFHRFFRDGEREGDSLVIVTCGVRLLRGVELDRRTFGLRRGRAEAGEEDFLFEATVRVLDVEQRNMLVIDITVLNAEDSVKAGEQFLGNITTIDSHG